MIIFDLDNTLADCSHRRHYIDPTLSSEYNDQYELFTIHNLLEPSEISREQFLHKITRKKWKPNWDKFFDDCDKDKLIVETSAIFRSLRAYSDYFPEIEIWSGRSELVCQKTEDWLLKHGLLTCKVKMRPIGDYTPDDQLKEKWLDEALEQGKTIDMVFDDRPKVVRMWRRRGIFVFDVNQSGKEF